SVESGPADVIGRLARRAMFMRPAWLAPSAWLEHVPFAFWLVEAHRPRVIVELGTQCGVSYFAFCQAVEQLGLDASCFAVDTWRGDAHAGFYGEEVFARVRARNDAQYSAFSRLVRSSFDDALAHFSDGSIDLLHIDGLHTLEAVRHDFESWLPKLSERAVVVLHDTNVREHRFGVFRLVEALRGRYPAFEFVHGHGLAVLGVGEQQAGLLEQLYAAGQDDDARRVVRQMFARLGRATADAQAARAFETSEQGLRAALAKRKARLARLRAARARERAELAELRARHASRSEQRAAEHARLDERAALLETLRGEWREEAGRLTARADRSAAQLSERTEALLALHGSLREHERLLGETRTEAARDAAAARAVGADLERHRTALAATRVQLAAQNRALASAQDELQAAHEVLEAERLGRAAAGARLRAEQEESAAARIALDATRAELERERSELGASRCERETMQHDLAASLRQRDAAQRDFAKARQALAAAGRELARERQGAAAVRTAAGQAIAEEIARKPAAAAEAATRHRQELDAQASKLRAAVDERDRLRAEAEENARKLGERVAELARLTRLLRDTEARVETLEGQAGVEKAARRAAARLLGRAVMALGGYTPERPPRPAALRRLAARLADAGVLDADWYLACNHDVSAAALDPVGHYLLNGVLEGREPRDIAPLISEIRAEEGTRSTAAGATSH
ncbi:MAG TPA: class I SAM-dependent methyltransferase, partial [Thermohalobaculum sp.]|nr:class I SAM-dependent methyltransferase [Thermohalobaculum sp.]